MSLDDEGVGPLPRYVRFARALALVSGGAIAIAAGATVFATSGCSTSCVGFCHGPIGVGLAPDASDQSADAGDDATVAQPDGGAGGGPLGAPPLPSSWLV